MKIYTNELGHMTHMATMHIYGKNLKKSTSPEAIDRWPWNLVCSIVYASTTKVTNYDPGLTLTYFTSRSNLITEAFVWEKVKIIYFLKLIAALRLKVAWSIQLNELLKLNEYQRSRSFFDLGQRWLRFQS